MSAGNGRSRWQPLSGSLQHLLRAALKGARDVSCWPKADIAAGLSEVRFRGTADMVGPAAGLIPVAFDPTRTLFAKCSLMKVDTLATLKAHRREIVDRAIDLN